MAGRCVLISETHSLRDRPGLHDLVETLVRMAKADDVVWSIRCSSGVASVTVSGPRPQVEAVMGWLRQE